MIDAAEKRLAKTDFMASRADAAYLDFVTGVRSYAAQRLMPAMRATYQRKAAELEKQTGRRPVSAAEAHQLLDSEQPVRWRNWFTRHTQEMNWAAVIEAAKAEEANLERELTELETRGPGRLVLDRDLPLPDYYSNVEFHIQPGSYFAFPTSGYIYYFGTSVFHLSGGKDADEKKKANVAQAPLPEGKVGRILDLACSVGQSSQAWKERVPQAEVWGVDISAPMVRYAHKLAIDRGVDVNFAQMAAEKLKFPDGHFDLVYAYILYHELPVEVGQQVAREAFRVLRPGGLYVALDFPNSKSWKGENEGFLAYVRDIDQRDNGEPYSTAYCHSDLAETMRQAGFQYVEERLLDYNVMRVGRKP